MADCRRGLPGMLQALIDEAQELLHTVLGATVGAEPESITEDTPQIVQAIRFRGWLQQQRLQYRAAELLGETKVDDEDDEWNDETEARLLDQLDRARARLGDVVSERVRENHLIARLQRGAVITRSVFPQVEDDGNNEAMGKIATLASAREQLSLQYLERKKEVDVLQQQFKELTLQHLRLQQENRVKFQALREVQDARRDQTRVTQETDAMKQTRETLKSEIARNSILRNLFQALILASGLDWSEDDELYDILLSLSQPPALV